MKISLALGPRQPLSRQTAWGCLTSNLALPGSGSLLAGRVSGYVQLALALIGMLLTVIFGIRFILWALDNLSRLHDPNADQAVVWGDLWLSLRWALLGLGAFALAWLWAAATGLHLVLAARKTGPADDAPPRLG